MAALFIEEGIFEVKDGVKAAGQAAIAELIDNVQTTAAVIFHHGSPMINVSGDLAQGEWHGGNKAKVHD